VPQNRGLQLGEEQAPLFSPPDSRRPEWRMHRIHWLYIQQARGLSKFRAKKSM